MRPSSRHTLSSAGCNAATRCVLGDRTYLTVRTTPAALRSAAFRAAVNSSAARRVS